MIKRRGRKKNPIELREEREEREERVVSIKYPVIDACLGELREIKRGVDRVHDKLHQEYNFIYPDGYFRD